MLGPVLTFGANYLSEWGVGGSCVHVPFLFLHILALGCLCMEEDGGGDADGGSDGAGGSGALAGSLDFLFGGF